MPVKNEVALVIHAAYKSGVINFETYRQIKRKYHI